VLVIGTTIGQADELEAAVAVIDTLYQPFPIELMAPVAPPNELPTEPSPVRVKFTALSETNAGAFRVSCIIDELPTALTYTDPV